MLGVWLKKMYKFLLRTSKLTSLQWVLFQSSHLVFTTMEERGEKFVMGGFPFNKPLESKTLFPVQYHDKTILFFSFTVPQ